MNSIIDSWVLLLFTAVFGLKQPATAGDLQILGRCCVSACFFSYCATVKIHFNICHCGYSVVALKFNHNKQDLMFLIDILFL